MRTFRLAIDFDSTVWPLLTALGVPYEDASHWHYLEELYGSQDALVEALAQVMPFERSGHHAPFPGCPETLRDLAAQGVEIHVITHRPERYRDDVSRYLQHWDIPFHSLDCGRHLDKVEICRQRGIPVLIDDHPGILQQALDAGVGAYALAFDYNRHLASAGAVTAESWHELRQHLPRTLGLQAV